MRTPSLLAVTFLAVSALAVAGCSGPAEEAEGTDRVSIGSLMGAPNGEDVDWAEQERLVQEAVAECMREEGWEYIPVEYPESGTEWTPEDELAQYQEQGFGIAWWTLNQGVEDPNDPYADWVDPNQEYLESLDEDETEAYYASLYGTQEEQDAQMVTEIDPETGEEYQTSYGFGTGCQGEAYEEVNGDDPTQSPEYWEAVQVYYDELNERTEADPRIVTLNEEWAACMKDQGFEYESLNDFWETSYTELQARHDEIVGDDLYKDPFEGWTEDEINDYFENTPQDEIDEFLNPTFDLTADQREQLEALLADEIELAVAQFECSKDYNAEVSDIYAEIEEQYALEHEDELRQLAASLAEDA